MERGLAGAVDMQAMLSSGDSGRHATHHIAVAAPSKAPIGCRNAFLSLFRVAFQNIPFGGLFLSRGN